MKYQIKSIGSFQPLIPACDWSMGKPGNQSKRRVDSFGAYVVSLDGCISAFVVDSVERTADVLDMLFSHCDGQLPIHLHTKRGTTNDSRKFCRQNFSFTKPIK